MFVLTDPIASGRSDRPPCAEHRAQRPHLDGIAERRPGAVGLDVADTSSGLHAAARERLADHRLLRRAVRRGEPAAAPVLVHGAAADHRQNAIAVGAARPTAA